MDWLELIAKSIKGFAYDDRDNIFLKIPRALGYGDLFSNAPSVLRDVDIKDLLDELVGLSFVRSVEVRGSFLNIRLRLSQIVELEEVNPRDYPRFRLAFLLDRGRHLGIQIDDAEDMLEIELRGEILAKL